MTSKEIEYRIENALLFIEDVIKKELGEETEK